VVKKFGRSSKLLALLLSLTLVFVAGCQAIANVDFNTVLNKALKVTSTEGKQSIELKMLFDEQAFVGLPEEEMALMKLVSSLKLQLDNVKVQDSSNLSLNGSLIFGDATSIKFSLKMSDTLAVMELEGAKQPFVLDLTSESLLGLTGIPVFPVADEETAAKPALDEASMTALGHQIVDTVGAYAINNLPNPERIQVKPAIEPINGISTSLTHVHIDLDGPEIWTWLKKYVDALVADRAGLDKMVAGVFEILAGNPELWAAMGTVNPFTEGELDAPTPEEMVKEASDAIAVMLTELQAELKLVETEDKETLDEVLSKDLTIKADVYIDNKLDIRKQVYELSYVPSANPELAVLPLKGLTVKVESEAWNVNGAVKAEVPVATESAIHAEQLFTMQGYKILKQFDEKSTIYDLLKNKLHIGKQSVSWFTDDEYNPPIVTPVGVTIIPLRDTAEQLGAVITYDKKTKGIKVFDEATNTTIVVKIGSDKAVVNGKTVKWSFPVTVVDGAAYVPARNIASALGAKISWTEFYEDVKIFKIEREV
jgi:hypothetical protein